MADAADGHKRLVLVSGEPGIGKTRLAAELARHAHTEGANILFGRCDEEALLSYQPFVEALRFYVAGADAAVLLEQLGRGGGEVARIVPELLDRIPDLGEPIRGQAEEERYRLFDGVTTLIEAASQEMPLVLVVDDIHWADRPTLLLLRHLVRSAEPCRLLLIGTYRETELDRTHPLMAVLADLQRETAYERLALRGLDEGETDALLQSLAPHAVTETSTALTRAVLQETEGNPFFLHQIVQHYKEAGVLCEAGDGTWVTTAVTAQELGISQATREVVGHRLLRLSAAANTILQRAAVLGQDFAVELLERIVPIEPEALSDALDEAVTAGLVEVASQEEGTYRFSHPLFRETLYSELNALRRTRAHRQIAEALEESGAAQRGERLAELAYHFAEATPGSQSTKVVEYARLAGEHAMGAAAHEQAAIHFERALEALGPSEERERCEVLVQLGEAQTSAGAAQDARAALDRAIGIARRLGLAHQFAHTVRAIMGPRFGCPYEGLASPELVELHHEALALIGPEPTVERFELLENLRELHRAAFQPELLHECAREALEVAATLGDELSPAGSLFLEASELSTANRFDEAARVFLQAVRAISDQEAPAFELHLRQQLVMSLLVVGDMAEHDRQLAVYQRRTAELRSPSEHAWAQLLMPATRAIDRGDFARAEKLIAEADARTEELRSAFLRVMVLAPRSQLDFVQGHWDSLGRSIEQFRAGGNNLPAMAWHDASGLRPEEARGEFRELAAKGFIVGNPYAAASQTAMAADTCAMLGEREYAVQLYEMLLPLGHLFHVTIFQVFGSNQRALGRLAALMERWEKAEEHFEEALAMEERIGHRPALVWTRADYAAMLLQRNRGDDRGRARELASLAHEEAERMGMAPLAERARPSLGREAFPDGLTEREVDVLRLIAEGLSNRQIAEELVLSVRTVERHSTTLYGKIGASGRAAATAYAIREGLTKP